jgi:hypothetical protein
MFAILLRIIAFLILAVEVSDVFVLLSSYFSSFFTGTANRVVYTTLDCSSGSELVTASVSAQTCSVSHRNTLSFVYSNPVSSLYCDSSVRKFPYFDGSWLIRKYV